MRNRLISYVDLLFAGNPEAEDVKQEILQNTLDRFDDLVAQGKSQEAAYSLAITGIGDVSELLGGAAQEGSRPSDAAPAHGEETAEGLKKKKLRALAVGLYIVCAVPLFVLQNEVGLCLLLLIVAVATVILVYTGKDQEKEQRKPEDKLRKSIGSAVWCVGLVAYFLLSFTTRAWEATWLIFPLTGAVDGLIGAIMDLKEAK